MNFMVSSNARDASTTGSVSAICIANPSSSEDSSSANATGSTGPNSPTSWPATTSEQISSRHRSSNFCRTLATSGLCAACDHKSSQSTQEVCGSMSASGRQHMATSSSSLPAAVG